MYHFLVGIVNILGRTDRLLGIGYRHQRSIHETDSESDDVAIPQVSAIEIFQPPVVVGAAGHPEFACEERRLEQLPTDGRGRTESHEPSAWPGPASQPP